MATLAELRAEAKAAGVPVSEIRSAESAEELQGLIAGHSARGGKSMVRKSVKKAVAKKTVAKKAAPAKRGRPAKAATATKTVAKRGRPKGSVNKSATKATTAVKSTGRHIRNVTSTEGRHVLDAIDYSVTDGWNPREDSAPAVIVAQLRKHRGNREKVFEALKSEVWDFVGKKMADGSKRSLADAHAMLRYRIARTDWDFAVKTGQHKKSTKRAEYGTAGTGNGNFKRAKKSTAKATTKAPARRGRPPGSKNRTTATATKKRTVARKPAAKRGRPRKS